MTKIQGIMPALVTPFNATGEFNPQAMRDLIAYLLSTGVTGFYTTGGTGEGLLLDVEERQHVLEVVLDAVDGQVPVIAHVGAVSTKSCAKLAAHAASVGAFGVAAIPPIQSGVDGTGIKDYYTQIAEAANGLPTWLYYVPQSTGVSFTLQDFLDLFTIKNVNGVKYTSHNLFAMRNIIESAGDDFTMVSGPDEMCLPALIMGATGAIGTTYNIMSAHFIKIYESYNQGDIETAQTLQYEANQVIRALTSVPVIAAVKAILARMGFDSGTPRSPLRGLTPDEEEKLWNAIRQTSFQNMIDIPLNL